MDLPESDLVAKVAALRDTTNDDGRAALVFFSALQSDDIGALVAALSRVLASGAGPDNIKMARHWIDQSVVGRNDGAWERWRSKSASEHAAVQSSLLQSVGRLFGEQGGKASHQAGTEGARSMCAAARRAFTAVRASWPLLLPRLLEQAKEAASEASLRAAAYSLVAAWMGALSDAPDVKMSIEKRGSMFAAMVCGLAMEQPELVQRGALVALTAFLPLAAFLFKRADRAAERGDLFYRVVRLLGRGGEAREVVAGALTFLASCVENHGESKGLQALLPTVAPAALAAGREGADAGDLGLATLTAVRVA